MQVWAALSCVVAVAACATKDESVHTSGETTATPQAAAEQGSTAATSVAPPDSQRSSPATPRSVTSRGDTVVGRVSEVGADPATWLTIRPSGGRALRLGGDVAPLRSVIGAEVWLSGARTANGFDVERFEVRRVNGAPVVDGLLVVTGEKVWVRTRSGALHDIPDAPPVLRDLAGTRVWVTLAARNQAPSFGAITQPPR